MRLLLLLLCVFVGLRRPCCRWPIAVSE